MRMIALDTETTGLEIGEGHRIVEIGAVELVNLVATAERFHCYLDPERDIESGAYETHGLSRSFLSDYPVFVEKAGEFLGFIGDDPLIIHNAPFDLAFINMELSRAGLAEIPLARTIDTLQMARDRFRGAPASLDALCRRFGIDTTVRTRHGALVDAGLLAEVYLQLCGGRQQAFDLAPVRRTGEDSGDRAPAMPRQRRRFAPSTAERAAHQALLERIRNPVWLRK